MNLELSERECELVLEGLELVADQLPPRELCGKGSTAAVELDEVLELEHKVRDAMNAQDAAEEVSESAPPSPAEEQ